MKLSYNWLKRSIALDRVTEDGNYPSVNEIAEKLEKSGIEVHAVYDLGTETGISTPDKIIDMKVPREFPTYASMMWTANELCGLYHIDFLKYVTYQNEFPDTGWQRIVKPETKLYLNSTTNKGILIAGRIIGDVKAKESPTFIKDAVIANGYESTHILHDLPLYVQRNLGQEIELIDVDKLASEEINMCEAENDGYITVEGKKCEYQKGDLILECEGKVIGLYGYLYDDSVAVTEKTTRVLALTIFVEQEIIRDVMYRFPVRNQNLEMMFIGCNATTQMKALANITSYLYMYADAKEFEPLDILTRKHLMKTIVGTTTRKLNNIVDMDLTYSDICKEILNPNMTCFSSTTFVDENGKSFTIPFNTPSPVVHLDARMGSKFPSYRTRREECDLAQCLLQYFDTNRVGEWEN